MHSAQPPISLTHTQTHTLSALSAREQKEETKSDRFDSRCRHRCCEGLWQCRHLHKCMNHVQVRLSTYCISTQQMFANVEIFSVRTSSCVCVCQIDSKNQFIVFGPIVRPHHECFSLHPAFSANTMRISERING